MNRPLRHIEICKHGPALSGTEVLAIRAVTSRADIDLYKNLFPSRFPSLWLALGSSNFIEDDTSASIFKEAGGKNAFVADLTRLLTNHQLPYSDTVFVCYRQPLGELRDEYPALAKRTVWIPATGFFEDTWQDGPVVVTEADGLISNYIPTGTQASLVLAPDGTKAIGRTHASIKAWEGTEAQSLLRGCIAATRHALLLTPKNNFCLNIENQKEETMVRLALIRSALPPGSDLFIVLSDQELQRTALKKFDPRFRRFCEHAGISAPDWLATNADLTDVTRSVKPEWTGILLPAINAHGALIPT